MRSTNSTQYKIDRQGYQPTRRELKAMRQAKAAKNAPDYTPPKVSRGAEIVPVYDHTGHCYLVTGAVADSLTA